MHILVHGAIVAKNGHPCCNYKPNLYGTGNGLCPFGTTKGSGMYTGAVSKIFAVLKSFKDGVNGPAGFTKFVALIPKRNDSMSDVLLDSWLPGIWPGFSPLPGNRVS